MVDTKQFYLADEREIRLFQILKIDFQYFQRALHSKEEMALVHFIHSGEHQAKQHQEIATLMLGDQQSKLSCVNWKGRLFITGTDIVRLMTFRYFHFIGRMPCSIKKFEEGIFSDLRRLSPPHDCILEPTRSDFLLFLFHYDCVRSKKKQKVFYWHAFKKSFNTIFCDAVDRELSRIEMAKAVGLSIDEFIKSGYVPTGSVSQNSQQNHLSNVSREYDWTWEALKRSFLADGEGHLMPGYIKPELIHVIRNDISSLFQKYLRMSIMDAQCFQIEAHPELLAYWQQHFTKDQKPAVKASQSEAQSGDSSGVDSYPSPLSRRRRLPKKQQSPLKPQLQTPPKTIRAKLRVFPYERPAPFTPEQDDCDSYSCSTLSSNEEEVRNIFAQYRNMVQPLSSSSGNETAAQMILSLSNSPVSPQPKPLPDSDLESALKTTPPLSRKQSGKGLYEYEAAFILLRISRH